MSQSMFLSDASLAIWKKFCDEASSDADVLGAVNRLVGTARSLATQDVSRDDIKRWLIEHGHKQDRGNKWVKDGWNDLFLDLKYGRTEPHLLRGEIWLDAIIDIAREYGLDRYDLIRQMITGRQPSPTLTLCGEEND